MIAVSFDGKEVNVWVSSRFQPPPFQALHNLFGQESRRPLPSSPKVPVRLCSFFSEFPRPMIMELQP